MGILLNNNIDDQATTENHLAKNVNQAIQHRDLRLRSLFTIGMSALNEISDCVPFIL